MILKINIRNLNELLRKFCLKIGPRNVLLFEIYLNLIMGMIILKTYNLYKISKPIHNISLYNYDILVLIIIQR